jgi:hypothetical protein
MATRKRHSTECGYRAERMNPYVPGQKVVIYVAAMQALDVGAKYAVVCDAHGTMVGTTSMRRARIAMKEPDSFCEGCRRVIINGPDGPEEADCVEVEDARALDNRAARACPYYKSGCPTDAVCPDGAYCHRQAHD